MSTLFNKKKQSREFEWDDLTVTSNRESAQVAFSANPQTQLAQQQQPVQPSVSPPPPPAQEDAQPKPQPPRSYPGSSVSLRPPSYPGSSPASMAPGASSEIADLVTYLNTSVEATVDAIVGSAELAPFNAPPLLLGMPLRQFLRECTQEALKPLRELVLTRAYKMTVPFTTREMREGESQGKPYHFVTVDDFQRLVGAEVLIEHGQRNGVFYGTPTVTIVDAVRFKATIEFV
eukprot:m.323329 g.323329  ORF g.323329 m.323329 type:complete len:232 (-) comp28903_c0_seq1:132-827(-)